MSDFSGEVLSIDIDSNETMAAELGTIIQSIVTKIDEIDDSIRDLVKGGLEGSAVETAAGTYIRNRKTLSGYVQIFAQLQMVLEENAEANRTINRKAEEAAMGV